ncbi:MAG: type III-A CRISPR-associated protein Csm2 [Desulfohalobiaceae bacterium]|nr:type III-A CRISPR-associated protein Csm2 [Desulfohalobiaceae bacterium]
MVQYFQDSERKVINPELLNEQALSDARTIKQARPTQMTSAQLRRFYGEAKNLEKKATDKTSGRVTEEAFAPVFPLVKMLKSKVAYAANPSNPKVPKEFKDWMEERIDAVQTASDFQAFLLHFEAVVGFCYGEGMK